MSAVRTSFDQLVAMPPAVSVDADDPGLSADAELEARIDAAHERMIAKGATDDESLDAFGEFYRLVLARSKHAQVKIELERRKR